MGRARGYLVGLGITLWALSPLWRSPSDDSFPASTYPMFAGRPSDPWVFTVIGMDGDGGEHRLSPTLITGSFEVMQAAETVRLAIFDSADSQKRLCLDVARRIAASDMELIEEAVVVGLRIDPIRYFVEQEAEPLARNDYARCGVPGDESKAE